MEYEIFEPLNPEDEYYDELCKAAWADIWNSDVQPIPEVRYV